MDKAKEGNQKKHIGELSKIILNSELLHLIDKFTYVNIIPHQMLHLLPWYILEGNNTHLVLSKFIINVFPSLDNFVRRKATQLRLVQSVVVSPKLRSDGQYKQLNIQNRDEEFNALIPFLGDSLEQGVNGPHHYGFD